LAPAAWARCIERRTPAWGREVALKVLPAACSNDQDRLHRFEQEARAAGMLNHPRAVPGFVSGDRASRWSADGRSVCVHQPAEQRTKIFLIDVVTGQRRLWKELAIAEPAGTGGIRDVLLTADGKSYLYWYVRDLSDLYLVEGVK
jgi:hypothetical protein